MAHRVGLIGCVGSIAAARQSLPTGCVLTAVCDIRDDLVQRWRSEDPSVFATTDYRELAARPDVDSVVTYTPNHTHCDIAVAMLAGGKHVFIEKPMGVNLDEGRQILEAERPAGKHVAVDLEMRVVGVGPTVKQIIDTGEIGDVAHVQLDHHRGGWLHTGPSGVYRTTRKEGGLMRMEGIHSMDLFRLFAGEVKAVQSFVAPNVLPHYEVPDNITTIAWFESGALGRYTQDHTCCGHSAGADPVLGPRAGHAKTCRVIGTLGSLEIDLWRATINVYRFEAMPAGTKSMRPELSRRLDFSDRPRGVEWFSHDMAGCRRLFLQRMAAGLPPAQPAADAFKSEQLAWAAELSSFEGSRRVELREVT